MIDRATRILLIGSTLGLSWLGMMAVHEGGHVANAWLSGGQVQRVVLSPTALSRTDVEPNPHPRFVVWGGPIWGCVNPFIGWIIARQWARGFAYLFAFFAGFCFIANGAYLAGGAFYPAGDAADLLRLGTRRVWLVLCGVPAIVAGLWMWHGLGPRFGLGPKPDRIDRPTAIGLAAALLIMGTVLQVLSSR